MPTNIPRDQSLRNRERSWLHRAQNVISLRMEESIGSEGPILLIGKTIASLFQSNSLYS